MHCIFLDKYAMLNKLFNKCLTRSKYSILRMFLQRIISFLTILYLCLYTFVNVYNKSKIIILACLSGSYGENCTKRCGINCRDCNSVNGLCDFGCKPGWTGIDCNQSKIFKSDIFILFYFFRFF